jgi:hypothetical protein
VVFATQSLADIETSTIAPAIVESCPTRLFLPNDRAVEPQIAAIYRRFGLNERQIEILARATPKRDYYCQSRRGNRLFDLGLGEVALAFCAASSKSDQFLQPGRIAQVGIDAGKPILAAAGQLVGYVSFFENFIQIAVLLIAWFVVLVAFFILAIQLFVTLIEFKLTTLAGFVLVPFGLFAKTAFLAERVLGNVVSSGIKVLVLAVVVGIGTTLFGEFIRALSDLLINRNGVCIIATHSPVVLQEVPRSCVWKVRRTNVRVEADRPRSRPSARTSAS